MQSTLSDRIQKRLKAVGKSERAASLEAGLSDAFIRNIRLGKSSSPRSDTIQKLAGVLKTTEAWLLREEGPESIGDAEPVADRFSPQIVPGSQLVSPDRMPVYAAARGGEGHVIVTFEAVDYVKRPAELENVRGGYGLLIYGDSMMPAFREGDMALVNPNLPPQRERNVVLYHTPPHGEAEAIVKQLNGWTDKEWLLQQWNPAKEFREFRQEWPICHRVVGRYDAR